MTSQGDDPWGLAINGAYLYITYFASANVYKCPLATLSTTEASPCENTGADKLNDVVFSSGNAHITNYSSNNDGNTISVRVKD